MGSSGTGSFSDYPGTPHGSAKGKRPSTNGASGEPELDQCERRLDNVPLEEVARCDYYVHHQGLPPVGTSVSIRPRLVGQRLGVESTDGGEVVGLLPTEYNYLLQCMKQNFMYVGQVTASRAHPIPLVRVALEPRK
jgi:hypothetical protein